MLIGLLPASTKAATKNVTVDYLGYCGTVTCGSKTKSGKWWKMQVNGRTVFCMDLGNTCHNGDAYKSSSKTYSTADGGTSKQMASLAYWFDKTMKRSNRAYIMTQALVWSIENGGTSQAKLKDVIKAVKNNTGKFTSSVDGLYTQIFQPSGDITAESTIWQYGGSGSKRQRLVDLNADKDALPEAKIDHIKDAITYHQRINIFKVNDEDEPLKGAKFKIVADNIDELYSFTAYGKSNETGSMDDIGDHFEIAAETDADGMIVMRFTYKLQSENYYYAKNADSLTSEQKTALKKEWKRVFEKAQENDSLMWQTVISFDNRWLEENGLYQSKDRVLDEERLKGITRSAVRKMLEKEGLQNAVWSAAVHYNTDNIHIHIASVEPHPMREKKAYIQYEEKMVNGRMCKQPILDQNGKPVVKREYKGTFKPKSIEACRREVVNEIIREKENNLKINSIIRDSIVKQKREHPLAKDKELCSLFFKLYRDMPDCNRNMWNYNNPIMNPQKKQIDAISQKYIEKYHGAEYQEFLSLINAQAEKYKKAYGESSDRNYTEGKLNDLYTRMGNAVLTEIRAFDKQQDIKTAREWLNRVSQQGDGSNLNHKQMRASQVRWGVNLTTTLSNLKKGLKSEWEKTQLEREHDQIVENAIE